MSLDVNGAGVGVIEDDPGARAVFELGPGAEVAKDVPEAEVVIDVPEAGAGVI